MDKKLRTVLKIHGGKNYVSDWLISKTPKDFTNRKLFDVCGGAGTFLIRSPQCKEENYNDIDPGLFNLFKSLTEQGDRFLARIMPIEYEEIVFNTFKNSNSDDSFEQGIRELVVRRMSRGGLGKSFSYSDRLRGGICGDVNAWNTWKLDLPKIIERLKGVKVTNKDVIKLIQEEDNEDVMFFIDPPYLPSTRSSKQTYNHEMTEKQHKILGEILKHIKGKAMICGYDNPLYNKMFTGWNRDQKMMANHSGQTKVKQKRCEVIWFNY